MRGVGTPYLVARLHNKRRAANWVEARMPVVLEGRAWRCASSERLTTATRWLPAITAAAAACSAVEIPPHEHAIASARGGDRHGVVCLHLHAHIHACMHICMHIYMHTCMGNGSHSWAHHTHPRAGGMHACIYLPSEAAAAYRQSRWHANRWVHKVGVARGCI